MARPSALPTLLLAWTLLVSGWLGRGSAASGSVLDEYSYYERVAPVLRPTLSVSDPSDASDRRLLPPDLTLSLAAFNETFDVELTVSASLFSGGFKARRFRDNASAAVLTGDRQPPTDCYYSGRVAGCSACVAAFNLCREVTGFFTVGGETYLVEGAGEPPEAARYIFRASDARRRRSRRDSGGDSVLARSRRDRGSSGGSRGTPARSSAEWTPVRAPAGSDRDTRFIELYLVMDRALYFKYRDGTEARGIEIVNYASALLRPLNIYIVLVGVEVWQSSDRISISSDLGTTLANFLYHRQYYINPSAPNDNAQLLLGGRAADFDAGVLGKAEIAGMCTRTRSGGVVVDSRDSSLATATIMAHELGHNLGLLHDESYGTTADDAPFSDFDPDKRCPCSDPSGKCIMSGVLASGGLPTTWSQCSRDHLPELFSGGGADACLLNVPSTQPASMTRCGNYLVEQGEECDCGPLGTCDNQCCNAATCRLKAGATCGTGECCDLATCSYATAGRVCRSSRGGDEGGCDLAEYCNGSSPSCPEDMHLHDGAPCSNSGGRSYCYQGLCRTRGSQCRKLWGDSGRDGRPECYATFNRLGSAQGHCGYDALYNIYSRCEPANAACGALQCEESTEKLAYWQAALLGESVKTMPLGDGSSGTAYCHSVTMDASPSIPNPAMVPDGAPCGSDDDGRVCLSTRCVPLAGVAAYAECTKSCGGRGRCNNLLHCHCDAPYAPPFCREAGAGGSVDSGPATSTAAGDGQAISIPLIIAFVCLVPLAGIVAAFAYYYRGWLRQSSRDLRRRRQSECFRWISFRYRNVPAGGGSGGAGNRAAANVCPGGLLGAAKGLSKPARPPSPAAPSKRLSVEISMPMLESTTNKKLDWNGSSRCQLASAASPRQEQQPTTTVGKKNGAALATNTAATTATALAAAAPIRTDVDYDCPATSPLLPPVRDGCSAKNSQKPVLRQPPTAGHSPLLPPAPRAKTPAATAAAVAVVVESSAGSAADADGGACSANVKPAVQPNVAIGAASKSAGSPTPAAASAAAAAAGMPATAMTPTEQRRGGPPAVALRPPMTSVQQRSSPQPSRAEPAAGHDARQKQLAAGAAAKVTRSPAAADKLAQPPVSAAVSSAAKSPTPVTKSTTPLVAKKPLALATSLPVPEASTAQPSALKRMPSLNAGKPSASTAAAAAAGASVAAKSRTPTAMHKTTLVTPKSNDPLSSRAPASPSTAAARYAAAVASSAAAASTAEQPQPCLATDAKQATHGGGAKCDVIDSESPKPPSPKATSAAVVAAVELASQAQTAAAAAAKAGNSSANNSLGLRAINGSPRLPAGRQQPVYENVRAAGSASGPTANDNLYDDVLVTPRHDPRV